MKYNKVKCSKVYSNYNLYFEIFVKKINCIINSNVCIICNDYLLSEIL